MSVFSEYLTYIKNKKNINSSKLAQLLGLEVTTVYRWINGERLPSGWDKIYEMVEKLHLSDNERRHFEKAYEVTLYGKEKYDVFNAMKSMIQTAQRCRKEIQLKCENLNVPKVEANRGEIPSFARYTTRIEILKALQNVLFYLSEQEDKKLYLKLKNTPADINSILDLYFYDENDCVIQEIIQEDEDDYYNLEKRIKSLSNLFGRIFIQKSMVAYKVDSITGEEWIGENWVLSDKFFLQFNSDLKDAILTTDKAAIEFGINNFNLLVKAGKVLGKNMPDYQEYLQDTKSLCKNISMESQPCIMCGIKREQIEEVLYEFIPNREMFIDSIYNEYNLQIRNDNIYVESFFEYEGLIRFMETGVFEVFPYGIYNAVSMNVRCELLRSTISVMKDKGIHQYMLNDDFEDIEALRIENTVSKDGEEQYSIEIDIVDYDAFKTKSMNNYGVKHTLFIEDRVVQQSISEFYKYLKSKRVTHSSEETIEIMEKVLKTYEERV